MARSVSRVEERCESKTLANILGSASGWLSYMKYVVVHALFQSAKPWPHVGQGSARTAEERFAPNYNGGRRMQQVGRFRVDFFSVMLRSLRFACRNFAV